MGRGKLRIEFMENKKPRMVTFKKRKEGLMKMLHQLTTLCGVGASMIIHDSDNHKTSIWPPEKPEEVRRMIDVYENSDSVKWYTLPDYFGERQRKVEKERMKLRSEKYASCDDRLSLMDEAQLRELADALDWKAEMVRSRIGFLKREFETVLIDPNSSRLDQEFNPAADMGGYMASISPQNCYTPPPPPQQCMDYSAMVNPNSNRFYPLLDQEFNLAADMGGYMASISPQNCYAPPPLLPPQQCMDYSAMVNPNSSRFYPLLDQEFNPAADMGGYMASISPQNCYAPPPLPPPQQCMDYSAMVNPNYCSSMENFELDYWANIVAVAENC